MHPIHTRTQRIDIRVRKLTDIHNMTGQSVKNTESIFDINNRIDILFRIPTDIHDITGPSGKSLKLNSWFSIRICALFLLQN